ncbi:MAG TPA: flagellar hook-basal body complex protein FliE [Gemmatimonadaceae bacterium]|nr:flagellar hook-basal body complex protein FliE [Gemmatimonadaceae bacterium]
MTAPIGGVGGGAAPRQIGLDIAGENSLSKFPQPGTLTGSGASFADTLRDAIGQVSESQDVAQDYIQKFVRGEPVELHQVMAATEEAGIALSTLIEIRNKLTDAYKTIVNMQG